MGRRADNFAPGSTFGGYLITRRIGSGGMAKVYEAVHVGLKKRVALKALNPELTSHAETRTRFLGEGEAASRIRHPNVVDITDVGTLDGVAYLVMEYLEGETLDELISRKGVLEEKRAVDIMVPVVAAVAAAHDVDVIHRDIKPGNVFLARSAHGLMPKVLDFGISKVVGRGKAPLTAEQAGFLGTPHYMSPEQARDFSAVDSRCDQYALGVVLYEAVTGKLPFEADGLVDLLSLIVEGEHVRPRDVRLSISAELETIIERAMHVDPAARFGDCMELGRALLPLASRRTRMVWEGVFGFVRDGDSVPPPANDDEVRPSERPGAMHAVSPSLPPPPAMPTVDLSGPAPAMPEAAPAGPPLLRIGLIAGVVAMAVTMIVVFFASKDVPPPPSRTPTAAPPTALAIDEESDEAAEADEEPRRYQLTIVTEPGEATIRLDGTEVGTGTFSRELLADGASHELLIQSPGFIPQALHFVDTAPPERIVLSPLAAGERATPEERSFGPRTVRRRRGAGGGTVPAAHVGESDTGEGLEPADQQTGSAPTASPQQTGTTGTGTVPAAHAGESDTGEGLEPADQQTGSAPTASPQQTETETETETGTVPAAHAGESDTGEGLEPADQQTGSAPTASPQQTETETETVPPAAEGEPAEEPSVRRVESHAVDTTG